MDVTLEELLEVGAHFGHHSRRWNPKMAPFIYGVKDGIHVFDLAKTRENLLVALDILKRELKKGKLFYLLEPKSKPKRKLKKLVKPQGTPILVSVG